jgi:muramoyltetrapeptide carboxypeptidase
MIIPPKLCPGQMIRVIAPSRSGCIISTDTLNHATKTFENLGLRVSFGRGVFSKNAAFSASIEERLSDLHEAFRDPAVHAIFTIIGGYNSNELLPHIDYTLIKNNPKIFCGYSDITALQNALLARINLVTYSGPHFSSFGMQQGAEYLIDHFKKMLMQDGCLTLDSSPNWSDDPWFMDQKNRTFHTNEGPWALQEGNASGQIIGANLCTFLLLFGTPYMPSLSNSILFIEGDAFTDGSDVEEFTRALHALSQQSGFEHVRALALGRFESKFGMTRTHLEWLLKAIPHFRTIPIVANLDFGHTMPITTLPIGGYADLRITQQNTVITIQDMPG